MSGIKGCSGVYPRTKYHLKFLEKARNSRILIGMEGKHHSTKSKKLIGLSRAGQHSKGWHFKHSKKSKENIRKGRIEWMQTHKKKFKETKIEKIMKFFLTSFISLKIIKQFEYQVRIKKYLVDFLIPEWNLVIECFGKYWHSGIAWKLRDKKRIKALEKIGYKVLVFWDYELLQFKNIKALT